MNSQAQRALAAKRAGIKDCIKFCKRSGPTDSVLALAISALLGAAWLETSDLETVARMVKRLRYADISPSLLYILLNVISLLCDNMTGNDFVAPNAIEMSADQSRTAIETVFDKSWTLPERLAKVHSVARVDTSGSDQQLGGQASEASALPIADLVEDDQMDMVSPGVARVTDRLSPDAALLRGSFTATPSEIIGSTPTSDDLNMLDAWTSDNPAHPDGFDYLRGSRASSTTTYREEHEGCNDTPQVASTQDCIRLLTPYLEIEKQRCADHGHRLPQDTFLTSAVLQYFDQLNKRNRDSLLPMYVSICSPEAVAALRETVLTFRHDLNSHPALPSDTLSLKQRYNVIESVCHQMTYLTVLKRCHILKLWEDCKENAAYHEGWVVVDAPQSSNAGNPRFLASKRATHKLLSQVYPEMTDQAPGYKRKCEEMKKLLKLGERLHILTETFGEGVLGLMQCSELNAFGNINDSMFVELLVY